MALFSKLPLVFIQNEGQLLEVNVHQVTARLAYDLDDHFDLTIEGFLTERELREGGISQEKMHRMIAAHPINLGGIPSTVILRCPHCSHLDPEVTHECCV